MGINPWRRGTDDARIRTERAKQIQNAKTVKIKKTPDQVAKKLGYKKGL